MWFLKKIDVVYLWVDGSDKNWFKKKEKYIHDNHVLLKDKDYYFRISNDAKRFKNSDELKYSLRSLNKYANWINNIFIVTDNQTPKWLNTANKRIHLIDHKDIMPEQALPCYNSNSIEHCVSNISGLSEFFILANDDMFFGNHVHKSFFFTCLGKIKWYIRHWDINPDFDDNADYVYEKSIVNASHIIERRFNKLYLHTPFHNMQGLRKSLMFQCRDDFDNEIKHSLLHHFRHANDVQWAIYLMYAHANNKANKEVVGYDNYHYFSTNASSFINKIVATMFKKLSKKEDSTIGRQFAYKINTDAQEDNSYKKDQSVKNKEPQIKKIKKHLWYLYKYSFVKSIYFENNPYFVEEVLLKRPNLFCVNHCENMPEGFLQNELEKLFPDKSEFEV